MNKKIHLVAKRQGFCCEFSMLTAYSGMTKDDVRKKTRMALRSIQYRYAELRAGKIACDGEVNNEDCMKAKAAKLAAGAVKKPRGV